MEATDWRNVMFDTLRWILACSFGFVAIFMIIMNYACVYVWLLHRKHSSMVPFIGGVSGVIALRLCPIAAAHKWAWLPLLVDLGGAFTLLGLLYVIFVLKGFRR